MLTGLGGGGRSLGAAVAMLGFSGNFLAQSGARGVIRFNQIDPNRCRIGRLRELFKGICVEKFNTPYLVKVDNFPRKLCNIWSDFFHIHFSRI